jgi:hypothetical protein
MYEDVLAREVKFDMTDGIYSISIPKGLDEKDLYKSISFILARTLVVMTQESWSVEFKTFDDHISFNIEKALEEKHV